MFDKSLTLPVLLILSIWCFQIPPLAITLLTLLLYKLFACFSRKQNVLCLSGSLGLLVHGKTKVPRCPSNFFPGGKCPVCEWEMKVACYAGNGAFVPELLVLNRSCQKWDMQLHKPLLKYHLSGLPVLAEAKDCSQASSCVRGTNSPWAQHIYVLLLLFVLCQYQPVGWGACMGKHSCEAVLHDVVWRSMWSRLTSSWKQVQMAENFWKCSCMLLNWASVGVPQRVKSHFSTSFNTMKYI